MTVPMLTRSPPVILLLLALVAVAAAVALQYRFLVALGARVVRHATLVGEEFNNVDRRFVPWLEILELRTDGLSQLAGEYHDRAIELLESDRQIRESVERLAKQSSAEVARRDDQVSTLTQCQLDLSRSLLEVLTCVRDSADETVRGLSKLRTSIDYLTAPYGPESDPAQTHGPDGNPAQKHEPYAEFLDREPKPAETLGDVIPDPGAVS